MALFYELTFAHAISMRTDKSHAGALVVVRTRVSVSCVLGMRFSRAERDLAIVLRLLSALWLYSCSHSVCTMTWMQQCYLYYRKRRWTHAAPTRDFWPYARFVVSCDASKKHHRFSWHAGGRNSMRFDKARKKNPSAYAILQVLGFAWSAEGYRIYARKTCANVRTPYRSCWPVLRGATISLSGGGGGWKTCFQQIIFFTWCLKLDFFFTHQLKPDFFFHKELKVRLLFYSHVSSQRYSHRVSS